MRSATTTPVILLAVFLDALAYAMLVPLAPEFGRQLQIDQAATGLVFGIYAIGLIGAVLPLLLFGQRCPPARILGAGVTLLVLALAIYPLADQLMLLLLARLLQGAASGLIWTGGLAVMAREPSPIRRGRNMGLLVTAFSLGMMLGPPLAGALLGLLGPRMVFLVALALAAPLVWLWLITVRSSQRKSSDIMPTRHLPLLQLLRDPVCQVFCGAVAVTALAMGFLEPVLPIWLEQTHGRGGLTSGLLFGLLALSLALAAPLAGARLYAIPSARLLRLGLSGLGLLSMSLPLLPPALLFPVMAGIGLICGVLLAPTMPGLARRMENLGNPDYAVIYALFNLSFAAGLAAGPLLGGLLAEYLGGLPALLLLGAAMLLAATRNPFRG